MNIYHMTADAGGYDTYSDCVVAANTEDEARKTHPSRYDTEGEWWLRDLSYDSWTSSLEAVEVKLIGTAVPGTEAGVICSSYHAG